MERRGWELRGNQSCQGEVRGWNSVGLPKSLFGRVEALRAPSPPPPRTGAPGAGSLFSVFSMHIP